MLTLTVNKRTIKVRDLTTDSRKVQPGDVFIAYKGVNSDSHSYIKGALQNGAKYIIGEYSFRDIKAKYALEIQETQYIQVQNGRQTWALLEAQKYGNPEKHMKFIGITGTDGKTTTSTFIYSILKQAGLKAGLLSTVEYSYFGKAHSTGAHTTTPPPNELFRYLKEMYDAGVEYVVLEVTSHGLAQHRVYGIDFEVAGITNITPEHLDFHKTYDDLVKAKLIITTRAKKIFVNKDVQGAKYIKKYAPKDANIEFIDIKINGKLSSEFSLKFPGHYNVLNANLAYTITQYLGINEDIILKGLNNTVPPLGRFTKIPNNLGINLIVDFAHTPNSYKELFSTLAKLRKPNQKIIAVFGTAGERDAIKRPIMGEIAATYADIIVLTLEDPRCEDGAQIIKQIEQGVKKGFEKRRILTKSANNLADDNVNKSQGNKEPSQDVNAVEHKITSKFKYFIELDRIKAIRKGIKLASKGDWVLILGKGHEDAMTIGKTDFSWSDIEVAKEEVDRLD